MYVCACVCVYVERFYIDVEWFVSESVVFICVVCMALCSACAHIQFMGIACKFESI